MKRKFRIFAAALAALSVISVSGCAISAALEEENGFKYNSSQVSKEEAVGDITYHNVSSPAAFGGVSAPSIFSDYTEKPYGIVEGDIYVSVNGSDETGDGSKSNPYATVTKAQSVVRAMKAEGKLPSGGLTVSIMAGEYRLSEGLVFTEEDSGTEDCPITYAAYGDGEVIFKGTVKLNASDFTSVGDDIKAILPDESKDKVLMIDLSKYGITKDQLKLYDIGSCSYVRKFDESYLGQNVQLVFNKQTLLLARYPNDGEFAIIDSVVEVGGYKESKTSAIFKMRYETAERVKSWHSFENIWCVGTFYGDWNSMSSKVSFDFSKNNVIFDINCFDSHNKPHSDTPYMFYNVLDELDVPGEYYIDQETCMLYMYPTGDMETADIELLTDFTDDLLNGDKLAYTTFMGLSFLGSQGNGAIIEDGDHVTFYRCYFYCVGGKTGKSLGLYGYNNTIDSCEAHYVQANGFDISGGSKETLTRSNSVMQNCYVTHWAMTSLTGERALEMGGFGTVVRHCEAGYSTSSAASVWNAEAVFEYNIIHDCTKISSDMGALYYGDSVMGSPNNTVRYNIIYNIGGEYATAHGVYWDHGHGSQRVYGNLLVNIGGAGIMVGGGRNNSIIGNVIVNTGENAIYYNDAMLWGYYEGTEDEYFRGNFGYVPRTQQWYELIAYLPFINLNDDESHDAYFLLNPAMTLISDNIMMNSKSSLGNIFSPVRQYSTIVDNYTGGNSVSDLANIFVDPANGDYRIREDAPIWDTAKEFKDIPYHLIGRY